MALRIYNSLTKNKEIFEPLEEGNVKMYVCGPTVYNNIHIGNARPFIFFDVVRKYLTSIGYAVQYVMNFTDVDDKLIRKAEETGRTVPELADTYIRSFYEDTGGLGIQPATIHPRVTENMAEIIDFIESLVNKGYAYEKEGDVFFRTSRFPDYGKLSHQNLDELQYGIRIDVDERKEDPRDFVLWKQAKPGEIFWSSPWGNGRPGWHIECSTMARKYLGPTIDIHGGGQDLKFPHHECERAQSEALTGEPLAKYWMHNGYLNINNEKMSKSLANGINVNELLGVIKPQVLRYFMLSAHYRNPLNFSEETINQAKSSVERIENCGNNLKHRMNGPAETVVSVLPEEHAAFLRSLDRIQDEYHDKMQDDFNTPDAITAVFELVSEINLYLQKETVFAECLDKANELFVKMNQVLGIVSETAEAQDDLVDEEIDRLIEERAVARKNKNWARADEIRDLLNERGIVLEDTPQGLRWRRK